MRFYFEQYTRLIVQRPQEAALFFVKVCRKHDRHLGKEVTTFVWLPQVRHSLSTQAQHAAVGCASRDAQHQFAAIRGGNRYFTSQHGYCKRYLDTCAQVNTFPGKLRMGNDMHDKVDIATSRCTLFTLARDTYT